MRVFGKVRRITHIVDGDVAIVVAFVLLGNDQMLLIWRQLHVGYLLHMLRHHYEIHFTHVGFRGAIIDVSDSDMMTYDRN